MPTCTSQILAANRRRTRLSNDTQTMLIPLNSYDDNDAAKGAPAASSGGQPPSAPAEESKPQIANGSQNNYGGDAVDNSVVDNASQGQEYEDDDDDVDFNLGGGPDPSTALSHTAHHDEAMSPVTQGGFQKSSAKEDG